MRTEPVRSVSSIVLSGIATGLLAVSSLSAQVWSTNQLREEIAGFHEPGMRARLAQIGRLIDMSGQALPPMRGMLQGNHREYLIKIGQLLDRLADDRWSVREDAERRLVEVGARALSMIEERGRAGETLEERVRSARICEKIARQGTEDEKREVRLLRGLASAASYFPREPKLAAALVSAADHTDPMVVESALVALGFVGGADNVSMLANRFREMDTQDVLGRRTVLASLVRLPGDASAKQLIEWVVGGQLSRSEMLALSMDARMRRDNGAEILAAIQPQKDPVASAAASIVMPSPEAGSAGQEMQVRVTLGSREVFEGPLVELTSSLITVGEQDDVVGLPLARFSRNQCNSVEFLHEAAEEGAASAAAARIFTMQGSLLSVNNPVISEASVQFDHPVFGRVELAREDVQGIALDPGLDRLVGTSPTEDRLRMADGSIRGGDVVSLKDGNAVMADGSQIAAADLAGVLFRRTQRPSKPDTELYTRIDLTSGDRLLVHLAGLTATHLAAVVQGFEPVNIPLADVQRVEFEVGGGALWGFTLIADYSDNKIIELDDKQNVTFELEEMYGVWDAECLDNGNLLVVEFAIGRAVELRRDGTEVWSFDNLKNPYDADRLPNGNTLIADTYSNRVIEVDPAGEVVWSFEGKSKPLDVQRLANGNTLIADGKNDRVVEINRAGDVVWEQTNLVSVWDADRLPNGNTLITQRRASHRVFEIDRDGNVVFEITDLANPSDADRLPNGNTLVAEDGRVREFDRFGAMVWETEVQWSVEVNRY